MAWRGSFRSHCRNCERPREPDERFSARGRCDACGIGTMVAEARQLHAHSGPHFDNWRRAMAKCVGATIAEDES